uniref:NADH dehydrogenase subunit 4L n=1 Tax=Symsagittifera roscoffensis TaxID=84072 RepID=E3UFF1_SYMRO|nr:NADH dehydrogenase subunit 4L [Symsagittifera roscoffensis]ADI75250.1 NADH dehydrogenase subunit 4L [Symsagittifera roscoffensis]
MIMMFLFTIYYLIYSMSSISKNSLKLLMMLEFFIINFLLLISFKMSYSMLMYFSVSFLMMSVAVLAATLGLTMLSKLQKSESNLMDSGF